MGGESTFRAGLIGFLAVSANLVAAFVSLISPDHFVGLLIAGTVLTLFVVIWNWRYTYKRYHRIADTPTSRIASAPQGYVELMGWAKPLPGNRPEVPVPDLSCVWWRHTVVENPGKHARVVRFQSSGPFLLEDETGSCVVDPESVDLLEMETSFGEQRTWKEGERGHLLRYLAPDTFLYALGEFASRDTDPTPAEKAAAARAMLRSWKRDVGTLLKRFDADRSGGLDAREWAAAGRAVVAEVERRDREIAPAGQVHCLRKPRDGRPFVLSPSDPAALLAKLRKDASGANMAFVILYALAWGFAFFFVART